MNKVIILFAIALIVLAKAALMVLNKKDPTLLVVSFFILTIPFHLSLPVLDFNYITRSGTLGTKIYLMLPLVLSVLLFPRYLVFPKNKGTSGKWLIVVLALTAISLINPLNDSKTATLAFASMFFSHIIFFHIISTILTREEIIEGLFQGLVMLCFIQFVLAICYPVLGIRQAITFIHETGERGATRMGSRPGAIGAYSHPGILALFTIMASVFFLSCYLNNHKKTLSKIFLLINTITLVLTYSRTAYMAFIIDAFAVYYIYKNAHKSLFSFKNILKFVVPTSLLLLWLIFYSPLSSSFLESDASEQFDNRMIHWVMALETFKVSPIFGVGINTHLEFFQEKFTIFRSMPAIDAFFWENPIHNTHLIMLVETGLIGFVLWLVFIIQSILKAKEDISKNENQILSMTHIGILLAYILYGITGWAAFSLTILPYFFFITYFTIKYRGTYQQKIG